MNRMLLLASSTARIEEQVELFGILGTVFTVAAVLFLIISVTLFFTLDIRTVIGEKTGHIAKRSIAEMERMNAQTGKLLSKNTRKRKKETDTGMGTGQMKAVNDLFDAAGAATGSLESAAQPSSAVYHTAVTESESNIVSMSGGEDHATAILGSGENATTVLEIGDQGTSVLSENQASMVHYEGSDDAPTVMLEEDRRTTVGKFLMIKNIMLIHTDEYI